MEATAASGPQCGPSVAAGRALARGAVQLKTSTGGDSAVPMEGTAQAMSGKFRTRHKEKWILWLALKKCRSRTRERWWEAGQRRRAFHRFKTSVKVKTSQAAASERSSSSTAEKAADQTRDSNGQTPGSRESGILTPAMPRPEPCLGDRLELRLLGGTAALKTPASLDALVACKTASRFLLEIGASPCLRMTRRPLPLCPSQDSP